MNYKKIYDHLILDAKINPKLDDYKESHHIVPLCLGGTDDKDNLVYLTARQHYLAHWLLYKIYKTPNLIFAWHSMSRISVGQEHRSINSHLFCYCRKQLQKVLSKKFTGEGNNFYGKSHTEETKLKISKANKGKIYKTQEQIDSWINSVAKAPKSKEHREKIGRKGMVMLQNIHTLEFVRVYKTDEKNFSSDWVNPKKLNPDPKYKCDYCDVITNKGNLNRWHNENCKNRK